jgi:peptidoglycan/xylan/chitin deacetylase (PgdA/CDA1 family)
MYHDVVDGDPDASGRPGAGPDRYKLTWKRFIEHLDRIQDVVPVPPSVSHDENGPSPSWSLTFDDGGISAVAVAEELLRRTWRGYFFVTSGLIGAPGFVDESAIRELDRMGHVVGSHSVTHPARMASLTATELLREWSESVAILSDLVGKEVRTASVPGGYYRSNVADAAARAGITTLFTSEPVRNAHRAHGCLVIGRYTLNHNVSAADAARAAAGDAAFWFREYLAWNVRKPAKLLGGDHYDRVRRRLLARPSRRRRRDYV